MEEEALQWFQWAHCLSNYMNLEDFTTILYQEFGPSELEDSTENLVKLKQLGTLKDYVIDFRRLANRTKDISPALLKLCFIGGLKLELRHDVKLLKPKNVLEVAVFAHQIVAKLIDLKVKSKPSFSQSKF